MHRNFLVAVVVICGVFCQSYGNCDAPTPKPPKTQLSENPADVDALRAEVVRLRALVNELNHRLQRIEVVIHEPRKKWQIDDAGVIRAKDGSVLGHWGISPSPLQTYKR